MHASWDRKCPEFIRRSKAYDDNHPENNMVYFPTDEGWTLTTRPDRIPLEERFPQRFVVNSIQTTNKKNTTTTSRERPTKRPQAKGKGKEKAPAQKKDDLRSKVNYEECFATQENNDVERLLGNPFQCHLN
jgi:hypothetical protein